ncbi:sigma-70 family RNA polymerase sigma factor [Allokutzneria multivorans]|uniref:Sigma-70 family RNA polymerase sigma factor n=1 Tax=Allokutzneria multivorans TaxID=1142134 RepID=A0ABP7RWF3_9PSEU
METKAVEEFERERSRLFGLAYRMLGSAHEAEDVVHDAFLRWDGALRADVVSPPAWLTKVVTNLCLNRLSSARVLRERYVGPWLPEPIMTADGALGPLDTAEQRDSVSLALLVLLEQLTPTERAVFVLREAFAYGHREIAEILDLSEANCRQLHRRAHQRVGAREPRFEPDPARRFELVQRFLAAAQEGDLQGLESLLAEDVASWADGGGHASMARRPILGRDRVARYLTGGFTKLPPGALTLELAEVNGAAAAVFRLDGVVAGVVVPEVVDDRVVTLCIPANPAKLTFLAKQLSQT